MCTAITFHTKDYYFGRNLDFEHGFGEIITVTPRNYPFSFRKKETVTSHYAIIGMALVEENYPLYFDATNEAGLSIAGLYFPDNAVYLPPREDKDNIAPFELIPWILGQCANIPQTIEKLNSLNLVNIPFNSQYPLSPLHWFIADKTRSITVEPTENGLQIFENPVGVLTNNPPFDYHMYNLSGYLNVTREEPLNRFAPNCPVKLYSRGMGAIGLPGDLSSPSRFIKATFTKLNSVCGDTETESISQFFHILGAVAQQNGCVRVGDSFEKTIYTSCCNTTQGIYYYTTYGNSQITGVSMHSCNLNSNQLITFPIITQQQIQMLS